MSLSGSFPADDDLPAGQIIVPDPGVASATVSFISWLVGQGETVMAGERIAEVVVEGVLVEIRSPIEGTCRQVWIAPGTVVRSGQVLGEIVTSAFIST